MASKVKLLSTVAASLLLSVSVAAAQSNMGSSRKSMHGSSAEHGNSIAGSQSRGPSTERPDSKAHTAAESMSEMGRTQNFSTTGQAPSVEERAGKSKAESAENRGGKSEGGKSEGAIAEHGKSAASESKSKASTTGQASPSEIKGQSATQKRHNDGQAQHQNSKNESSGARKPSTTGQAQPNENARQKERNAESHKASTPGSANENNSRVNAGNRMNTNARRDEQASTRVKGAKLDAQQVKKVQRTVLTRRNVPRVEKVNFSINVGIRVPSHVQMVAVPSTLVEVYPEWRSDMYFVTSDEIVIVDHSRRIVAVVPANSNEAVIGTSTRVETSGESSSEAISITDLSPVEIREVQTVLIRRGYLHARVDGVFGPETREALITFQRKRGLRADGRIDARTVSSLGLSGKIKVGEGNTKRGAERGTSSTTGQAPSDNRARGRINNSTAHEQPNSGPRADRNGAQSEKQSEKHRADRNGAQNERSKHDQKGAQNEKHDLKGAQNEERNGQQAKEPNAKRSTTGLGSESQAPTGQPSAERGSQSMQNNRPHNNANGHSTSGQGGSLSGPGNKFGGDSANGHNPKLNRQ